MTQIIVEYALDLTAMALVCYAVSTAMIVKWG